MNDLVPELRPTPGRRWFAALSLLVVGGAAAWFGLFGPDQNLGIRVVSAAAAAGLLLQAWRCRGEGAEQHTAHA